jgi:2-keto-4-pentenoate hydratase
MTYSVTSKDRIDAAAAALLHARARGALLPGLAAWTVPQDIGQAYAIQDAVAAALGPIGGWKVGAQGPHAEPTCAPLPASLIHRSPHVLATGSCSLRGIEAEIAVRIKHDLPPRPQVYTSSELASAIASVHPAIEVVCSRFTDFRKQGALSLLADSLSNGALIVGPGQAAPFPLDQAKQPVQLHFGMEQVAEATGGNPAGDIWRLLSWLANHVAARCGGLRAGQIVTTGSCTGMLFAGPDIDVSAVFPGIGEARVSFRDDRA